MTLNTRIYVLDPVPVRDLFAECNRLLGATERIKSANTQDKTWRAGQDSVELGNPWTLRNKPGQGLPALLDVHYRPDVPLRTVEQAAAHEAGWCDSDCSGEYHSPPTFAEITFDTGYSYKDVNGAGCGDLHARLIRELGPWLEQHGARWRWRNEFSGEVYSGYEGLETLGDEGKAAFEWMTSTVLPAIANHLGLTGGAS